MRKISLLPADSYTVINKTLLTDLDKKNLINLYEPIVGCLAISLYLTLWSDLDKTETISKDFTHHHLMTFLKAKLDYIKEARESLEAVGLIKTYIKQDKDINHYIYELYSPISAYDFFNHPVLNVVLYNNIGENEYKTLKLQCEKMLNTFTDNARKTLETVKKTSIDFISQCERENKFLIGKVPVVKGKLTAENWIVIIFGCIGLASLLLNLFIK